MSISSITISTQLIFWKQVSRMRVINWIIEDGRRVLLKGGFKNDVLQPFNEVLGSIIADRLGFNHVTYTLDAVKGKLVSKCECFINKNTEYVPASQIMYGLEKYQNHEDYETYVKILETNGITDARLKLENMYVLDYILMNDDRHLKNFGIIRDVETLKWLDVVPIFDNGQSLNIIEYNDQEIIAAGEGRMFYQVESFDEIIKVVRDFKRFDFDSLDGVVDEFDNILHEYQSVTNMSDERINKVCTLLYGQINKLKGMVRK